MALGQARAAGVRPTLAGALAAQGEADRAIQILESYLRGNPADTNAKKQLNSVRPPPAVQPFHLLLQQQLRRFPQRPWRHLRRL